MTGNFLPLRHRSTEQIIFMLPALGTNIHLRLRRTLVRLNLYSARYFVCLVTFIALCETSLAQNNINQYNVAWTTQSNNAAASMPCGGGDIGTNVWVENGSIYLYIQQSGWFDENNTALKAGRIKIDLSPNPFAGKKFKQELILQDGYIYIQGGNEKLSASVNIWVDAFNPIVHIDVQSNQTINATAAYESWRYKDRVLTGKANNANSWKWAKHVKIITPKDSIAFHKNAVVFYHQNKDSSVFDYAVQQQGLEKVKNSLYNPLRNLLSGGMMFGSNMQAINTYESKYADTDCKGWTLKSIKPNTTHHISVYLNSQPIKNSQQWLQKIEKQIKQFGYSQQQHASTKKWWQNYWNKSFIHITDTKVYDTTWRPIEEASMNYQLFRYLLGCNATGKYPTKFNGGLFTIDPVFTDTSIHATPDHRNWGGGTFTAQNQRLVYWPMLKTGDADLMQPQFNFYKNLLNNAALRSKVYWNHDGACFTEQLENFGLPNPAEYGYKRPDSADKGVEYNKWLEYEWDTVLEFCLMILEAEKYNGMNITEYIPLIKSCLTFFDKHYEYEAKKRGMPVLDSNGHLVLFPGSAAETFKKATNATSTIAALQTVTNALLQSAHLNKNEKFYFQQFLQKIPPISYSNFNGKTTIAPAQNWERVNNTETPQLYPVFPYGIFGLTKAGLDTAINTYWYDTLAVKFRSHIGWKQDNIFAARLGLTEEAKRLTLLKLTNGKQRFPAFWGPGFDWTPDHNHGGSAMIGLQEMLLQTDGKKILLFPAWPKDWHVHFKLHAPFKTTVEVIYKNGKIEKLEVLPKEREKDVLNLLKH
jgi:hypothetical protein